MDNIIKLSDYRRAENELTEENFGEIIDAVNKIYAVFDDGFKTHVDRAAYNIEVWMYVPDDLPDNTYVDKSVRHQAISAAISMALILLNESEEQYSRSEMLYIRSGLELVYCTEKMADLGLLKHAHYEGDIIDYWNNHNVNNDNSEILKEYIDGTRTFAVVPQ